MTLTRVWVARYGRFRWHLWALRHPWKSRNQRRRAGIRLLIDSYRRHR